MYELRFRLAGLLIDRSKVEVMHSIDLVGARERAMRPIRGDVVDVDVIERTPLATPASGEPLPAVRSARETVEWNPFS
jgi:hypothetical protein